jgi:small nuclear ribonucleoprotein (snRNP)-like protein
VNELYSYRHRFINQRVRVHTIYGHTYEGTLVNVDSNYIYLDRSASTGYISSKKVKVKAFVNPILTLALFDVLAIALIV